MPGGETNNALLIRIESKVDGMSKEVAEMKLDFALKFSNYENLQDKRYVKFESYLESDPKTKQEGAIEKLDRIEKSVNNLKIKAVAFGTAGAGILMAIKWIISKLMI